MHHRPKSQNQTSSEGSPCKGEECRDRHGDTFQRKDVHRRQWRFVTYDGIIFSESQRKERLFDIQATNLDFQIANDIVVSNTHAKVYINELGASLWIHVVKDSPSVLSLGRPCN